MRAKQVSHEISITSTSKGEEEGRIGRVPSNDLLTPGRHRERNLLGMLDVAYESVDLCSARAPRGLTYSRGIEAVGVMVRKCVWIYMKVRVSTADSCEKVRCF